MLYLKSLKHALAICYFLPNEPLVCGVLEHICRSNIGREKGYMKNYSIRETPCRKSTARQIGALWVVRCHKDDFVYDFLGALQASSGKLG